MRIALDIANLAAGVEAWPLGDALAEIEGAEHDGFDSVWVPQLGGGADPLSVCAIAASRTSGIALATGVVPAWGHHPVELARAALTLGAASGSRFVLGIGASHRDVVEATYGVSFARPAAFLWEYVTIVRALLDVGEVKFEGERLRTHARLDRPAGTVVPLAVAAGGPAMLRVAGQLADIAVTNMAGARTLRTHTIPELRRAADGAERDVPRVAVACSICVTNDEPAAKDQIDDILSDYARMADYRAMLDREGVDRPSAVALVGTEDGVTRRLDELEALGVGEVIASIKAREQDQERTRAFLRSFATGW